MNLEKIRESMLSTHCDSNNYLEFFSYWLGYTNALVEAGLMSQKQESELLRVAEKRSSDMFNEIDDSPSVEELLCSALDVCVSGGPKEENNKDIMKMYFEEE